MERINQLVNKLKEQADAGTDANVMLGTVELIERELLKHAQEPHKVLGTSKVAVVLPAHYAVTANDKLTTTPVAAAKEPQAAVPVPSQPVWEPVKEVVPAYVEQYMPKPSVTVPPTSVLAQNEPEKVVIPTPGIELQQDEVTFNDKLKQEQKELQHALQDSSISDLKKAIGINDRFLFINELFRGDEDMYERSIHTINNFNAYGEADFWITRELKVKLGWAGDDPLVQSFTQLIRRRFS